MLPCILRNAVNLVDRDGVTTKILRCAHIDAATFTKPVTEADCEACPMRVPSNRLVACSIPNRDTEFGEPKFVDGNLVYPRTGWEPPRVPYGFKRSEEDAWVMIPTWQPCGDRELHARKLSCGCLEFSAICGSAASGREGQLVTLEICEGCPVRRRH